ncbi:MAG: chorismate synthase [Selenomonadaceae bacterium]|nr:chorismate synthase [Selenomonadaceae bacterium]
MSELRFMTAGESHGPQLTAILEGLPAGVKINKDNIDNDLARRQQGYGRGGRMKIERDKIEIVSGVRFGETIGSPITLIVKNRDWQNWQDRMSVFGKPTGDKVTAVRPGHADLTGVIKYNRDDARDILERSSARETTMLVAVGAVCKEFLKNCGVSVTSRVTKIGGINNTSESEISDEIKAKIDEAKSKGDTLGGIFEVIIKGVPIGLGSHIQFDKKLDAKLAAAMMSIQAIKGVEIGAGFECANLFGSQIHDEIFYDEQTKKIYRPTNHAGGIEGGMSNGEDIIVRVVMKPIPTLMTPLKSIDIATKRQVLACKERSDTCAVEAAAVVGEAMAAFVIAQAVVDKFGGDSLSDILSFIEVYNHRI